jgi:TonB family protein
MKTDKSFGIALIFSFIIHGVLFLQSSNLNLLPALKSLTDIEITYIKSKEEKIEKLNESVARREISLKSERKDLLKRISPPPFTERIGREDVFRKEINPALIKPQLTKPDIISIKRNIQLKPVEISKISSPGYINYYQIVREKIRRCAYQNYTRNEIGQVYLTFVILSNGSLENVKIIDEKSTDNSYLKDTALRSIKGAAPFPPFPKELEYPRLSFNVIISFEIE